MIYPYHDVLLSLYGIWYGATAPGAAKQHLISSDKRRFSLVGGEKKLYDDMEIYDKG